MELGNRDRLDDDRSSVSSFAVVADNHYGNDVGNESDTTEPGNGELYKEKKEQSNTPPPPVLLQIAKVKFHDLLIRIFSDDSLDKKPRQFFFEPLVLLDPKSIVSKSHGFFKQDFICFTVQMWNEELRSKVLERLRSLEGLQDVKIGEEDVCVMPYEEVKLVFKSGSVPKSIMLMDQPTSYLRSNENLDFYLLCDVSSASSALAEDFRKFPEFTLKSWKLALECRGIGIQSGTAALTDSTFKGNLKRPTFTFNVSTNSKEIAIQKDRLETHVTELDEQVKGLQDKMQLVIDSGSGKNSVAVFSVSEYIGTCVTAGRSEAVGIRKTVNKSMPNQTSLTFGTFDFETKTDYGQLDLSTGLFKVKKDGIYHFQFNAHMKAAYNNSTGAYTLQVELRVNGKTRVVAHRYDGSGSTNQSIALVDLVPLKSGDEVGVYLIAGSVYEDGITYITRFFGVFHG